MGSLPQAVWQCFGRIFEVVDDQNRKSELSDHRYAEQFWRKLVTLLKTKLKSQIPLLPDHLPDHSKFNSKTPLTGMIPVKSEHCEHYEPMGFDYPKHEKNAADHAIVERIMGKAPAAAANDEARSPTRRHQGAARWNATPKQRAQRSRSTSTTVISASRRCARHCEPSRGRRA